MELLDEPGAATTSLPGSFCHAVDGGLSETGYPDEPSMVTGQNEPGITKEELDEGGLPKKTSRHVHKESTSFSRSYPS